MQIAVATPEYWEEACRHLARKDRVMKRLIPQFGSACLQSRGLPCLQRPRKPWPPRPMRSC